MDEAGSPPANAKLLKLRVLIIEDSWGIATSLKSLLERAGATVLGPVPTLAKALTIIRSEPLSAALVDLNLREAFADQAIEELVARNIPFIIITAYEALPTNSDLMAVDIIRKPIDESQLLALLGRLVGG